MVDPTSALALAINEHFGDWLSFRQRFTAAALSVFGSGWAWLVADVAPRTTAHDSVALGVDAAIAPPRPPRLRIEITANQDTPAFTPGRVPIMALDVWEHAYHRQHGSNRAAYVESWWEVLNAGVANRRYEAAAGGDTTEAEAAA